ncbi:MAG: 2-amino-4-hydroxy-6-hydroxymethyldihydropteridine diphosphokinase [Deinococcales bacterium]
MPPDTPALVALGSNLDDPLDQLRRAARALQELAVTAQFSPLFRTTPVGGPAGQPDFLNGVALLEPLPPWSQPDALLEALLAIERRQGRLRRERWGPRTLDLDLLALGTRQLETPRLTLPHPRMMNRAFVLAPLCELLPEWRDWAPDAAVRHRRPSPVPRRSEADDHLR